MSPRFRAGLLIAASGLWLGLQHDAHAGGTRAAAPPQAPSAPAASQVTTSGHGYRFERGGWIYVHLEGGPHDLGYQHGVLLAPEIEDAFAAVRLEMTHDTGRPWSFFQKAAHDMLWPKTDPEYQIELQGIVDGLASRGVALSLDDVVAYNAFSELPDYYVPWLDARQRTPGAPHVNPAERCSAFVATGSWTKDHQIVMAHNNWTTYIEGSRWRIMFDIAPARGYRMLMDGFPGVIVSDDDFTVNSTGLMVTETTISGFHGWDPNGKPEFVRARKAMQYAASIDDYVRIMRDGNNGGYANDWLIGDRKTGEIARFEEGLAHTRVWRTKDGYFVGSNFPSDPQVIKDETTFNARRSVRLGQRAARALGRAHGPVQGADRHHAAPSSSSSDHYDTYLKRECADQRTLCGHEDAARGADGAPDPAEDHPSGAVEGKVIDSRLAAAMSLIARIGHPCGQNFAAAPFLDAHPSVRLGTPGARGHGRRPVDDVPCRHEIGGRVFERFTERARRVLFFTGHARTPERPSDRFAMTHLRARR